MLFYERDDALEPVLMMDEISASACREAASLATGVRVAEVAAEDEGPPQVVFNHLGFVSRVPCVILHVSLKNFAFLPAVHQSMHLSFY